MQTGMHDSTAEAKMHIKGRLLIMRFIHAALVLGVAMFGGIVSLIIRKKFTFVPAFQNPMVVIAVVVCVSSVVMSFLSVKFVRIGTASSDVMVLLQKYQVFFLTRAALIEGGALFAGVVTMVTCNILPAVLFLVSAVLLAVRRPSQEEFIGLFSP